MKVTGLTGKKMLTDDEYMAKIIADGAARGIEVDEAWARQYLCDLRLLVTGVVDKYVEDVKAEAQAEREKQNG